MRCERCDAPLDAGALDGLCPVCLLDAALSDEPPGADATFRYDLIEEIARGGMGVVYRAIQHGSQRRVAVKMVLVEQSSAAGILDRFRAEAEAIASLEHPNILPVYEAGEYEGRPFYSMKLADAGSLRDNLPVFHKQPRKAAALIAQIARAVHHAHERGILHRDLKPGNILLDGPEQTPYVSDFGLAKWIGRENRLTIATSTLGTPHYIAPEQAAGASEKLTPAADVYSLGAMLYELLSGRPPFEGDTALETLRLAAEKAPSPPRNLDPTVPLDLELICLKCLAKEPGERYPSSAALAEDLQRWLDGRTILARRTGTIERAWRWTKRNRSIAALSAALLIALGTSAALLVYRAVDSDRRAAGAIPAKSIAVLPFENLTPGGENAEVAQGIQEEILTRLGQIAELKVISRTSTERFGSSPKNLSQIAQQLGVAHLLQGSMRSVGDEVRVRVQLTNAHTNEHLWAETYDRKLTDIFRVETEIARAVADKLQARLTGPESRALAARPTENAAAHQLYLKGRFFWNKRTAADLKKAIEYFDQAIALDPQFALAHAAIAETYVLAPFYGAGTAAESCPKAKAAASKAIELNDQLAPAHAALGETARLCDLDLAAAAVSLRRAIELDPNYPTARHWYGMGVLNAVGKFDEAIAQMERALELDPLSLVINADLGATYHFAHRYEEAAEQLRKTLEMDPNFYYARWALGVVSLLQGQCDAALGEFQSARRVSDDPWVIALQAHAYSTCGDQATARKLVDELHEIGRQRRVTNAAYTIAHLALGQKEEAIRSLEKSFAERGEGDLHYIAVDPYFDPLRGDPRFEALVAKLIPPTERSAATTSHGDPPDKSIAVLPFNDLSEKKDQEYFCDGVAEEVIGALSKIDSLQVAARTSSFAFKGRNTDVKEVANKLGVRHILEGSVRREGNRVRVAAQLINAQSGFQLWSERYERELQSIFAVQDEMSRAIADALKVKLASPTPTRPTPNLEAYDLYLQGMFLANKSSEEQLRKSLELFARSLEKDPHSAATWAGIAKAWFWLADAYVKPLEAYPKVREAATKALELDHENAEAHAYLADCERVLDYNVIGAEHRLRGALEIDPNAAYAHLSLALTAGVLGKRDEALQHLEAAWKADPLSSTISNLGGLLLIGLGDVDKAIEEGRRTLQIDPEYIYPQFPMLARAYAAKGMTSEAIALYKKTHEISGAPQAGLAVLYAQTQRAVEAKAILKELETAAATGYFPAEDIAEVYVALDDHEAAFRWLERAVAEHSGPLQAIAIRPTFDALYDDPRFHDILRRIGLDPTASLVR